MVRLLIQIFLLLTCIFQASPSVASSNPANTTFSTQVTQKVESEQKTAVFHFARSSIDENIISYKTTSHFATTKQSPSFLKDAFQNIGVLQLEKSLSKSWVASIHFSTKEKLSLLEHRAREVLADDVQGAGNFLTNKPSWLPNRIITGNIDNPKGLIGVYERQLPDGTWVRDTKNALEELNFPETYASNFVKASKDGYKMLNTNRHYHLSNPSGYWDDFNIPWLNGLKNSGADVVVLSDPSNDLLKFVLKADGTFQTTATGERILTGFGKEVQYMDNLVNQGIYQCDGVNGLYKYIGN